ncbi:MAG: tetratricopeptide repeat protein [Sterolibacterium sp.]|nr:tetratricopeptide repeat protein [Sterolibacterium sp.]
MAKTGGAGTSAGQAPPAEAGNAPSQQEINSLVALFNAGRYPEAEILARTMTERFPRHGFGWKASGAVLRQMGRSAEAFAPAQKAAELLPDDAEAFNNLGNAARDMGRLDTAEAGYRQALKIKPDYADAQNNLGIALHDLGRLEEAEASYRQALKIRPDYVEALNNLALLLNAQGHSATALNLILQSLRIRETGEARNLFVSCVKRRHWTQDHNAIRQVLGRALTEPWGRPKELARVSIDLVKRNPEIGGCVARAVGAWPGRLSAQDLFGANAVAALAADPLLCALLNSTPICDIGMERFLTMARRTLLEAATGMTTSDAAVGAALRFYCALACQCFINDYVFCLADDEIRAANKLRDSLAARLEAQAPVPVLWPVAVAAYLPLGSVPLSARLLTMQWPEAVTAVLVQQVCEPAEEQKIVATIPRLTGIEDEVSLLVRNQYEENPYPRWVKAAPAGNAKDIGEYLGQKFPLASFKRHDKRDRHDILIAGCGTGQHSIQTARQFHGAQVLAVDLSLSSLGYARRKTRELGVASIEYAQADLLKLCSPGRSFDIIESVGVLHHLADPLAGWRVLLSLLRPGGFMRLGFYSEAARRNIVKARAFIAEQGYGATANEIRQCRQHLMDLEKSVDFGAIIKSSDFFSISTCRDLLFHVQEHRMTLTGIDDFLRENNLVFLGFEIDASAIGAYKLRFPNDRAATNLAQWQTYERENPDTFGGMYQFWIQKAA